MKILLAFVVVLTLCCCSNRTKPVQASSKKANTVEASADTLPDQVFQKNLALQNYFFEIRATGEGSIQQLVIQSYGLTIDTAIIRMEVVGNVTDAGIADLNSDGFPEILIFIRSAGSGSYGGVIGYSVNNGKSMSRISFPNIADNAEASKGYMGHDQFLIVENTLVQRFQLYNSSDTNTSPTGNIRQVQYKLKDGESARIFVVDTIVDYPAKH